MKIICTLHSGKYDLASLERLLLIFNDSLPKNGRQILNSPSLTVVTIRLVSNILSRNALIQFV